jgi:hypothetical protein
MCVIHCQVSFFRRGVLSHVVGYSAFGIGELQDMWRVKMDPLGGPIGTMYEIKQVN